MSEPLAYIDFELEIAPGVGRDYPVSVLHSPAGEARAVMHFPFDDLVLENRLKDLQIALLRSTGTRRQSLAPEQKMVQEFGTALFDALLTGEVRSRYDVSQSRAAQEGKGLRLKLRIQPSELAALPWEFLFDPRQADYVCVSSNTPVVRYLKLPQPIVALEVEPPLRILAMIVNPSDLPELEVEREHQRLERAVAGLQSRGLVELHWLAGQTWRELQAELRRGPWHIFHFIGHGGFSDKDDEGLLALAKEDGTADMMLATSLARLLADDRSLRLVVLNACESARGGKHDLFSSTASILVRRGLPAVLAMQYEITDAAAIELSRSFYEALADGYPVDAALSEARKAISIAVHNSVEWGTPVLFTRSPDGHIFNLAKPEGQLSTALNFLAEKDRQKHLKIESARQKKTAQQTQIADLLQEAETALAREEWATAIAKCEAVLAINPSHAGAREKLKVAHKADELASLYHSAQAYQTAGKTKLTLGTYRLIQQIDPTYRDTATQIAALEAANASQIIKTIQKVTASILLIIMVSLLFIWGYGATGTYWRSYIATGTAAAGTQTEMAIVALIPTNALTLELSNTPVSPAVDTLAITPTPKPQTTAILSKTPYPLKITDSKGVPMALVPAGSFQMGGSTDAALAECQKQCPTCGCKTDMFLHEEPVHTVTLDAFYIDVYEVTNAHYAACVDDGKCTAPTPSSSYTHDSYYGTALYADYPVINVSWDDAHVYCEWRGGRLPTEAEWEKAARGGLEGKQYPWGDTFDSNQANSCDKNCILGWAAKAFDDGYADVAPVGRYAPNGYGLYDMAGNIWEWVNDFYSETYYRNSPAENPMGPVTGDAHVSRGGAWGDNANLLRVTGRVSNIISNRHNNDGFRCARSSALQPDDNSSTPAPAPTATSNHTATAIETSYPSQITTQGVPMALVPAGSFQMGVDVDTALAECNRLIIGEICEQDRFANEGPVHPVFVDAFYMDVYEVTNARYAECVTAGKCQPPSEKRSDTRNSYYDDSQYANYPLIYITWDEANTYCEWRGARLPTEAEWEKAARGGLEGKLYPWGDTFDGSQVNFCDKNCRLRNANQDLDDGYADTAPVGSYAPNSYGLYDMAGNVWEWVNDWYAADYYTNSPASNPAGPDTGDNRVLRGGSWGNFGYTARVAFRGISAPWIQLGLTGFRCAR